MNSLIKFASWLLLNGLLICLPLKLSGQANDSLKKTNVSTGWTEYLSRLEKEHAVRIFYHTDSFPEIDVSGTGYSPDIVGLLNRLLTDYKLTATMDAERNIFISGNDSLFTPVTLDIFGKSGPAMENTVPVARNIHAGNYMTLKQVYVDERIVIGKITNDNKSRAVISGYVRNTSDNSPVIGVVIRIEGASNAVMTDISGFYSLNVNKGDQMLIAGNLETKEKRINLKVLSDGRYDIMLDPKLVTLNAIIVRAEKDQIVKNTQMGYQRLVTKEIKEIPLVLGEHDVIKVTMLLPGVQSVGEGSAGLNVRGSPTDQNLFIINNIPVYNSSHLMGFFSAFNSDAIQDFELYKSNIPASFGGRLSSVFDIKTRQGNQNNFTANGGISPVTAKLTIEGPVSKKKSSYMIGVRSTYSDWILSRIDDPDISKSDARFADAIMDFSTEINKNNRLRFSSYHSDDKINIIDENRYNYANNGASLQWSHLVNEKNSFQLSLIYSRYNFSEKNAEVKMASYKDEFTLKHGELKLGYTLRPGGNHTASFGFNSILYQIDQGNFNPLLPESMVMPLDLESEKALESGLYISDEWAVTPTLTLTGGLRYNYYINLGPGEILTYQKDAPRSVHNITDTLSYSNNKPIARYNAPDIRFAARYMIRDNLSLKFSFTQMKQYLFMLTNTIAVSPTDKWKLCDYHIKPMAGNQFSLGIYHTLFNGKLDISAESYYKTVKNLVEFKNGANLVVNELPETDIVQGDLESYGVEFMINKSKGRFNGWLNYTWSRALVTLNSPYREEQINDGKSFPSNYDKPHAVNLVANYKFSRRFSVSSNIVYSTGRPISYPVGFYIHDNIKIPLYSKRNEFRLPDYFRVDLSLKLEGNLLSDKFAHGTWIFSVYNLTGRKNAYSVFFRTEDGTMRGYKLSVFGVPIVSLTYSFKLGNYAN